MDYPLSLRTFLLRAARYFPKKEVVSVYPNSEIFRYTYADYFERICQLAHALVSLGIKRGRSFRRETLNMEAICRVIAEENVTFAPASRRFGLCDGLRPILIRLHRSFSWKGHGMNGRMNHNHKP
jgi:hypothetical protein